MAEVNVYTAIGIIAIGGVAYYIYKTQQQNKKQVRMNPKHSTPFERQRLGIGLNNKLSRSYLKRMREHSITGIAKRSI